MVFCAGADLAGLSDDVPLKMSECIADIRGLFSRIMSSPRPRVGRINGHCITAEKGLGAGMDFSVAVARAKFGFTDVRVGVASAISDSAWEW